MYICRDDCLARKRGADIRFKMNTEIAIQNKQVVAERNRARSRMLNTPRPQSSISYWSWSSSEDGPSIVGDELAFIDDHCDFS